MLPMIPAAISPVTHSGGEHPAPHSSRAASVIYRSDIGEVLEIVEAACAGLNALATPSIRTIEHPDLCLLAADIAAHPGLASKVAKHLGSDVAVMLKFATFRGSVSTIAAQKTWTKTGECLNGVWARMGNRRRRTGMRTTLAKPDYSLVLPAAEWRWQKMSPKQRFERELTASLLDSIITRLNKGRGFGAPQEMMTPERTHAVAMLETVLAMLHTPCIEVALTRLAARELYKIADKSREAAAPAGLAIGSRVAGQRLESLISR